MERNQYFNKLFHGRRLYYYNIIIAGVTNKINDNSVWKKNAIKIREFIPCNILISVSKRY